MEAEVLKKYKTAGRIAADTILKGGHLIKKGEGVVGILEKLDSYVLEKGAVLAFPTQIAVNNFAAHFCPTEEQDFLLKEMDVVKLDVGVCVDGYIADTAKSFNLGGNKELVCASEDALNSALKMMKPGEKIGEIGREINRVISSHGFTPIRNLSGHGLGYYKIHGEPTIPNFDTNDKTELQENQVLAVEPFATNGAGIVYESSNPTLFTLNAERPVRSSITREVLSEIRKYHGQPFTTRWLFRKFGTGKTTFALRELGNMGLLDSHPPLLEKNKGNVSQAEHSVIIKDKPIIYTRDLE